MKFAKIFAAIGFLFFLGFSFSNLNVARAGNLPDKVVQTLNRKPMNMPGYVNSDVDAESKVHNLIFNTIDLILLVAGIVAVVFIVISGVRMSAVFGNQTQIDGARRGLIWACTGLILIILSWAIVENATRIIYTKHESPSAACREIGCPCGENDDCDSGICNNEGPAESPIGGKACQPRN